jgi:hypothetical protein
MDLLAYLASIERRADAVIDNAAALKAEIGQVRTLYRHQLGAWSERVRTPVEAVLPSELPDRTLGPALAKVRGFLCRAPGAPVDPEFDRVVGAVGLGAAKEHAEFGAALPVDEAWRILRRWADTVAAAPQMERAE